DTGIVTGITTVSGNSFFSEMQRLDWLYALGLMQVVSDLGLPVSTMGNNMLITRKAYEATGGYGKIQFSVTEDIALFQEVLKKGFGFRNVYQPEVLAWSEPALSLVQLLHQRKRWMKGSMHLPWYMIVIFVVHASYYPVLLPFLFNAAFPFAVAVFTLKLVLQSIFVHFCAKRAKIRVEAHQYILLEVYLMLTSLLLILFFFLPTGIRWKERRY
ncbi:MAG: glycosyltransferase, partial [Hymenobacteraceae bacterium]|nr:glycosyltransferase [Hymenobacteraceae bacterium]MDX5394640.1 glycosyltransferase [Hymenobacteraceae bacterium]MDX5442165.1 glycosyltransferase [Hymenobacteraceae bacterium]MDX5510671.1 glycosyltransferase [Hymenobacteraceae bacterium]